MTTPLRPLKTLLLDLIAPARLVDHARVVALTAPEWDKILAMVRQHRLGPLLHWQLGRIHTDLAVPQAVRDALVQAYREATLRSLVLQRELLLIHRMLDEAGIAHVALKGAFLAFRAYPHPGLRPMRDLDILVPRERAIEAYRTLIDGGLRRISRYPGDPRAFVQVAHHLPPLLSNSGQVMVELHSRLYAPAPGSVARADPSDTPSFWQRCFTAPLGNADVPFPSPTDLLLYLIVHSVFKHQFDNGPLLLSDLAFLLDTEAIDWPLFWTLAAQGQHTRGCLLTLKATECYWGLKPIVWPEDDDDGTSSMGQHIATTALLTLRDRQGKANTRLGWEIAKQPSRVAKARVLLSKLFISRALIRTLIVTDDIESVRPFRVFLAYPVRWWHLVTKHLPRFISSNCQTHVREEMRQYAELEAWLQDAPP